MEPFQIECIFCDGIFRDIALVGPLIPIRHLDVLVHGVEENPLAHQLFEELGVERFHAFLPFL